jgi:Tol biopolymer transport system component
MPRKSLRRSVTVAVAFATVLPSVGEAAYQRPGQTTRIVGYDGKQASDPVEAAIGLSSWQNAISGDGRYLAFTSTAVNLVPGDVNNAADVFLYDRVTRKVELVSQSSSGAHGAGECASSIGPSISQDGRYVAFSSCASNLVPGDLNAASDVFVRDRRTRTTRLVSTNADGGQAMLPLTGHSSGAPSISPDGRYVAFTSGASDLVQKDTNNENDVFLKDLRTGAVQLVSVSSAGVQANQGASSASVSRDGRFVAFPSYSDNLVPDDTNAAIDVFVRDVRARKTERVSLASGGTQGNTNGASGVASTGGRHISADGRYVMISSTANSFVPSDSNGTFDIFVWDRKTKRMQRVSVRSDGGQSDGATSPGAISLDGRYVVVASSANNLTPGDTGFNGSNTVYVGPQPGDEDVFVYDTKFFTMEMLSVAPDGTQAKGLCQLSNNLLAADSSESFGPTVSADGSWVGFQSCANNLAPGDTNATRDEFLRHRGPHIGTAAVSAKNGANVTVSGWSTFTGSVLTTALDPGSDGTAEDTLDGSELVGGSLLYRAEQQDLFLVLDVRSMPQLGVTLTGLTPPGDPRVVYAARFVANGTTYEVRVQRAGANALDPLNAAMGLFECSEVVCTEVTALRGGYGTTGQQVVVSIPLSAVTANGKALAEGGVLSSLRAYTGYGTYYGGATQLLDQLAMTTRASVTLPRKTVTVTVGRTTKTATLTNGRFTVDLPRSLFRGPTKVTVRSCLGNECRSLTSTVTV